MCILYRLQSPLVVPFLSQPNNCITPHSVVEHWIDDACAATEYLQRRMQERDSHRGSWKRLNAAKVLAESNTKKHMRKHWKRTFFCRQEIAFSLRLIPTQC